MQGEKEILFLLSSSSFLLLGGYPLCERLWEVFEGEGREREREKKKFFSLAKGSFSC